MKLAHLADLHLGFRQYHRQTPNGLNQREQDVGDAFRAAIDGVIRARPDAVVIAGDVFHSVRPTNSAILLAFAELSRLRGALPEAPIVLIAGNHDTPRSTETGSILKLFEVSLRVDVVTDASRVLEYPRLDLAVFAVPHAAYFSQPYPNLRPTGGARYRVLATHGEIEGLFPADRMAVEYGGALLRREELATDWSYVALGHYHVQCMVAPRVWYCGALDYLSSNAWGELKDEAQRGRPGKGWLLVDLERNEVTPQPVPLARRVIDLESIDGTERSAKDLDALIAKRVRAVAGGIADQMVRLVIWNVPRHVGRELDHAAIRELKAQALHFHLDLRRPETHRIIGMGSPGRRQTLPEIVSGYLSRRLLPAEIDREAFVRLGAELLDGVERDYAES